MAGIQILDRCSRTHVHAFFFFIPAMREEIPNGKDITALLSHLWK